MKKTIASIATLAITFCCCQATFAEEVVGEELLVLNQSDMVSNEDLTVSPTESNDILAPEIEDDEPEITEDKETEDEENIEEAEPAVWPAILVTIFTAVATVIIIILNLMG